LSDQTSGKAARWVEALRTGVRPTGAYWGAAAEQIDLWSGNLNFTVPLLKAQSRGGWSTSFALGHNSQMWRQEAGGSAKLSRDVGYGLGWILQAGSVTPVPLNGTVQSYLFTDATEAEYQLTSAGSGVYASHDGIYVWYDSGAQQLRFPDRCMTMGT
jgi:hypothetical protein